MIPMVIDSQESTFVYRERYTMSIEKLYIFLHVLFSSVSSILRDVFQGMW
jgi:hypothetical protein